MNNNVLVATDIERCTDGWVDAHTHTHTHTHATKL